ncbi:hypothetical protein ACLESO_33385 [Pyxidicoccus sp. 3LG]
MLLTRRRIAGAVLALALVGALSAGVASGVERVRGKARKRPESPPPFSQRDRVLARPDAKESASSHALRRDAVELSTQDGAVAPDFLGSSPARGGRGGRGTEGRAWPPRTAWTGDGAPDEPASQPEDTGGHAHDGRVPGLTARIPAPMRVGWTVLESSAGRVRLLAEVERRTGFGAPVAVSISLPADAVLLEGPADFTVPEGQGGDIRAVSYVVTFGMGTPPEEDLVLVAHAEGTSFGAHAEERYSFGRGGSAEPRPVPEGPVLPASLLMGDDENTREDPPH